MIRLLLNPYATLLIAAAQQRMALMTAMLEGVVNLSFSILLGSKFGATGVALGTLIGSVVSVAGHLIYNMPRTNAIRFNRSIFISASIGRPIASLIPSTLVLMFLWPLCDSLILRLDLSIACLCLWFAISYAFLLSSVERSVLARTAGRIPWLRQKV
jgi:O-antigen/teichoic acid export membrane protein